MMGELQLTTTSNSSPNNPIPIQTLPAPPRSMPAREDCWSEDATFTLIEAWGQRYIDLNRGNLRQKQWQEVADTVNARHGHVKKARRTDIQCKNRIDTLKKKYKIEKARVLETNGSYKSPWPFFDNLDQLIGNTTPLKKHHVASGGGGSGGGGGAVVSSAAAVNVSHSPPFAVPLMRINPHHHQRGGGMGMSMGGSPYLYANAVGQGSFSGGQIVRGQFDSNGNAKGNSGSGGGGGGGGNSFSIGVSTPVLPQKRTLASASVSPSPMAGKSEEYFRRNYAAVAAAAAREEVSDEESEEEEEVGREEREVDEDEEEEEGEEERGRESKEGSEDGIRKLARVIEKFGEVYARVEREKQKQLIELEKQRMQFAKELECQRMQMLVEMQVQLEKIKRTKRSNSDDVYS